MGSINGEIISEWDGSDSGAREDKIFVSVRLRPLNERELTHNDVSDWDCINNATIIFKNSFQERSLSPTAYTFDRVFSSDCPTRQVYEDSAKKTVLSVLSGINSTIFAYGQTSSGKTYTMSGITEYAIRDMYNYIDKHRERDFIVKFSAMEIYNEAVKDLLCPDATQLRLLDDPERGTVVEKLTEVTVRNTNHLRELLLICEAQRQTGETALNELSSRSHQILRLTVESEAHAYFGAENMSTLTASVNFVDLAGSERASQTMSGGARLKEGCHINRSLLTLGTVIRKLSKGRNGHVPYRNSKLTRILQNSLGGNAKTAIICTMSPAHSHVEQSRNTLLFASCAKQVSTNAQVNVVMSEKALVKHLQKELARLENELKSMRNLSLKAASGDSASALKEKELLIAKMDKEIRDLTLQRDLAQSHMENMLHSGRERQEPRNWMYMNNMDKASYGSDYSASEASEIITDPLRSDTASCVSHYSDRHERVNSIENDERLLEKNEEQFLADDISPTLYIDKYFGPDPCQGWEKIDQETCKNPEDKSKEVQCIEEVHFSGSDALSSISSSEKEDHTPGHSPSSSMEDLSDSESDTNAMRSKSCKAILTTVAESPKSKIKNENDVAKETLSTLEEELEVSNVAPTEDGEIPCATGTETSVKESSANETEKDIKTMDGSCASNEQETSVTEHNEVIEPHPAIEIRDDLQEPEDAVTSNGPEIVSNDAKTSNDQEIIAKECCDKAQDVKQPALEIVSNEKPDQAQDSNEFAEEKVLNETALESIVECPTVDEAQHEKQPALEKLADDAQDINAAALENIVECPTVNEAQREKQPALEKLADDGFDEAAKAQDIKETALEKIEDCATVNGSQHDMLQPAPGKTVDDVSDKAEDTKKSAEEVIYKANQVTKPVQEIIDDTLDKALETKPATSDWSVEFERQKREIIEFWDSCNIPLVHRTYFFLLFRGDPSDAIYMEVELRRLSFLKSTLHDPTDLKDGQLTLASSLKALTREREMLSKQMLRKLSTKDRELLFEKWGIDLKSKQRRLQLCHRLFTDTKDMEHIKESASIVAKLVGFKEPGKAPKEMVGLSFVQRPAPNMRSFSWRRNSMI